VGQAVRARRFAVLALLLATGSQTATARAAADNEPEARRHFDLGQQRFGAGDFDGAIDEFKRAYVIAPAPGLLFNIAQAYRAKKEGDQALFFYRTYLSEDPYASERDYVEARIEELRAGEDSRRNIVAAALTSGINALQFWTDAMLNCRAQAINAPGKPRAIAEIAKGVAVVGSTRS